MYLTAQDSVRDVQSMKPLLEECWFLAGEVEHYDREQMREVYAGVVGRQTVRAVMLYSSHELTPNQMHEIRMGIEQGLSCEDVLTYSSKKLPWQIMKKIREDIVSSRREDASCDASSNAIRLLLRNQGSRQGRR